MSVKDAGVIIGWNGNVCHCRCRHCSLSNRGQMSRVPFERAAAIAEKFVRWRESDGPSDFHILFGLGSSYDLPLFLGWARFCRAHDLPVYDFLANGISMRSNAELDEMFRALEAVGITQVTTTFFGIGENHDRFVGRRGDYDFLVRLTRLAGARGFERGEGIYLSRTALRDIPELVTMLDGIPGLRTRHVEPWDYRGRAKRLERDRPLAAEVRALPDFVQRHINHGRYRSEGELVAQVLARDIPPRVTRYAEIPIGEDNVEQLETADCGALLQSLFGANTRFLDSLPPFEELAQRYGRRRGRRLYAIRDLEWKWTDRFLADHPEVDGAWALDERRTTVMVHRSPHDTAA
jgi:hypothetical protein